MNTNLRLLLSVLILSLLPLYIQAAEDLPEIRKRGALRHLTIPYANFNTGAGDGLDVQLMKLFAKHLGLKYEQVTTSWSRVIGDLTGRDTKSTGDEIKASSAERPVAGDVIASGMTILAWREKVVAFSTATFPTQVWLVARADAKLTPIKPSGDVSADIEATKAILKGLSVLGKSGTCLDPDLYGIAACGAIPKDFPGGLNELAPALLKGDADVLLLDVPDCLVALRKWPGKLKVLGPISPRQEMAVAFRQDAPLLRREFETFLKACKKDGTYLRLVRNYYPDVFAYYPEFFSDCVQPEPSTSRKADDKQTQAGREQDR